MSEKQQSVFNILSGISVKNKIERKGNLDYLSWSNAWLMLKQKFPSAQRIVYESEATGLNYFTDGHTAYVMVGIEVEGLEHIDMLPIMDYRNNSILVDKITSFDVNKAIQRSTAKAIAMFGLGLSLWSGEDLPSTPTKPSTFANKKIKLLVDDENMQKVLKYIAENKDTLGMDRILTNLQTKYILSADVRKQLSKYA